MRIWRKGPLAHCMWECKLVQLLWGTVWMFPQKLKIELPYDPAAPLLGIYPKKTKTRRNICTPMFTAVFTTAKIRKQAKCPLMGEQRRCCICTQWSYHSAIKKRNLRICDNMDGYPWGYYAKWNKSEKDKYYMIAYICKLKTKRTSL